MNYSSVIDDMFAVFPNLSLEGYEDAIGLPHVVFGDIFCPWVKQLLLSPSRSDIENRQVAEAFHFIEQMLESEDDDLENVVLVTILNYLVDYCGRARVEPWCRPLSKSWLDRLPPP